MLVVVRGSQIVVVFVLSGVVVCNLYASHLCVVAALGFDAFVVWVICFVGFV